MAGRIAMKSTKKVWLAIMGSAALTVAVPGLASAAGGAPSGTHHSYASASLRHTLPLAHPAHAFRTHPLQRAPAFDTVKSNNWSGFATFGDHFRFVSSTYTIPSLNCGISPDPSFDSEWVGLDGFTSSTVEQAGTFAECSGGTPSYFAFYEMFPEPSVAFSDVSPGDSITAKVFFNGSQWRLTLLDNTTGAGFDVTLSCPSGSTCKNRNAEIISETPNGGPPTASLADYGIVGFTQIAITDTAAHHFNIFSPDWSNDKIFEVDLANGNPMQAPSKLEGAVSGPGGGAGNQAFTVTALAPN
jgi:peptidase A4-like protein